MRIITDEKILDKWLAKTKYDQCFSTSVKEHLELVSYEPDDSILRRGDTFQKLYFMVSGRAKVYTSYPTGKVDLLDFLDAPCYVGELEFFAASKKLAAVQAQTKCLCFSLPGEFCREQLRRDPVFLWHMCTFISERRVKRDYAYTRSMSFPLKHRLAAFILESARNGRYTEKHTEIAEYFGVTYRQLMNVMALFVKAGAMARGPKGYEILNEGYLRALAAETEDLA